jgi:predicted dehydrogenase
MNKLRVGLIGYGAMGKNHARILASLTGVSFLGIVDPAIQNHDETFSYGAKFYSDLDALLAIKLDYCVVAVPTKKHEEVATQILESGVNCLIEKPISIDLNSANKIKRIAQNNSLLVGVGYIERYNPAIIQMKNKLLDNHLGNIYQISTSRQGPLQNRIRDVGVLQDLATHDLDLIMWTNDSNFKSVFAQTARRMNQDHEDMAFILGKLENNTITNSEINWVNPIKKRTYSIIGEKGLLQADLLRSELTFYPHANNDISNPYLSLITGNSQGSSIPYAFEKVEPLVLEHENFRDYLLSRESNIISIDESIKILTVTEAASKSASTGLVIEL